MARRRSGRHSRTHRKAHHARTGRHVPHPGARGKPHPHRGSHVPHPGARHPRPRHESPAQAAAARASLAKARAAHPKGQRTAAQLAAARASLVKARAARKAHPGMVRAEDGSLVPRSYYSKTLVVQGVRMRRLANGQWVPVKARARAARHVAGPRVHKAARVRHPTVRKARTTSAHRAVHRTAPGTHTRHLPGVGGPQHHYNRHGLAKTTHWIAGHRTRTRRRARYAWTVRTGRRHGWDWTRTRRARQP